jgi:hypothetical protein
MSWGVISSRTAWIFLAACLLFEASSVTAMLAAANFSTATASDPLRLLHTGPRGADLMRLGSLLDMFGYLTAIPVVLYLRYRFREQPGIDFFTLAGILFLVMGALAAIILAFAAAPLIREYAISTSGKYATEKTFVALYRIVVFGIWQTLDGFLAGIWTFGVGWLAWRQRARLLAGVLFAIGVITAGFAVAHVSGLYPG